MLLRAVTITDPASPYHNQTLDVRVRDGVITALGDALVAEEQEQIFAAEDRVRLAPGFVDIGAYLGDPGHEEREDIASLTASARAGGYVAVAVLPNTVPVRQSVADMTYLASHNGQSAVDLLPIAALSHNTLGRDLTEMMELGEAGALAFTDGSSHAASGSLLKRALEYGKSFGGLVLDTPHDRDLAEDGQMHEGTVSVQLGLPGIPTMCETIPLRRDLSILRYTDGRLLVHLLSSAKGLALVTDYREQSAGLAGCTVSAHHLTFTDDELLTFDPNFKMLPPLRAASDREALQQGLIEGQIDAIVSHHRARHGEEKDLEFSYAAFGALGLETALRQLLPLADDRPSMLDAIVTALTAGPRRLLGLPPVTITEDSPAQLTLFTTEGSQQVDRGSLKGKSTNSPLLGRTLPGRILATINHGRLWTSA
ncbi:Dihydroorotase [Neolewinella maritima]|uniref:Dihydroorotase n=1 Tax=Neolewinella maritima TaxID=1383882 RepID=A0ABM9AYH5_9BACT|nr:dihydroorotase [Neolewinella maritima]CAH0999768.1 Dihydroorotase [Neolewinella maritima]